MRACMALVSIISHLQELVDKKLVLQHQRCHACQLPSIQFCHQIFKDDFDCAFFAKNTICNYLCNFERLNHW